MALSKEWYDAEFVDSESETQHRAPNVEYSFYNAVKTGDMEYVIKNCKEDAFMNLDGTGVLSRNTLQNIKYHFVVTTAMITRYCIDGGLEPEQAYRLSDFYILKMDTCSTVRQVADLHHEMAKYFTGKMVLQKKSSIISSTWTGETSLRSSMETKSLSFFLLKEMSGKLVVSLNPFSVTVITMP